MSTVGYVVGKEYEYYTWEFQLTRSSLTTVSRSNYFTIRGHLELKRVQINYYTDNNPIVSSCYILLI